MYFLTRIVSYVNTSIIFPFLTSIQWLFHVDTKSSELIPYEVISIDKTPFLKGYKQRSYVPSATRSHNRSLPREWAVLRYHASAEHSASVGKGKLRHHRNASAAHRQSAILQDTWLQRRQIFLNGLCSPDTTLNNSLFGRRSDSIDGIPVSKLPRVK